MDEAAVPVVGADAEAIAGRAREAGVDTAAATVAAAASSEGNTVVAVGEEALVSLARHRPEIPVLPVEAGPGIGSVPRDQLGDALEGLAAGGERTVGRDLLTVRTPTAETTALFDATLAAGPASISEYTVRSAVDGERTVVERVRADGMVVATPAGSVGYARAAGGPLVGPGTGVAVVVPLGPYAVERDQWVLAPPLDLTIERDEGGVALFADGREVGPIEPDDTVEITAGGRLSVAVVPEADIPVPTHKT